MTPRRLGLAALLVVSNAWAWSATEAPSDASRSSVEAGRYLSIAGNCFSCHTRRGGESYAGGVPFFTNFGTIYSSNITSDQRTGIGNWSLVDFTRAMRQGIGKSGEHLYPAFPYTAFTKISDEDISRIFVYLRTLKPIVYSPPDNELKFPLNVRASVGAWKKLFFHEGRFEPVSVRTIEENRGAYLVEGLGHCGTCHTPRNALGAEDYDRPLSGGMIYDYVPSGDIRAWATADLTSNSAGLKKWSPGEIVQYLMTGSSARAMSFGPMNEIIVNSTRHLSDSDLRAIALYLKGLRSEEGPRAPLPDSARLEAGRIIYTASCGSCHLPTGLGDPKTAPPLSGNAVVQAPSPATLINVILHGPQRSEALSSAFSRPHMPAFEAKLDSDEIALVATYVRNSWGNRAREVTEAQVADQR